jgi:hypothetical protein
LILQNVIKGLKELMNKEKVIRLCKKKGWRRKEFEKVNQFHGCDKANILCIRRYVSNYSKNAGVK